MSLFGSWRPSLRMARRDAVRARGRSILVLVMIALPVLAVTTADVIIHTSQVTGAESLDRRMGAADARVDPLIISVGRILKLHALPAQHVHRLKDVLRSERDVLYALAAILAKVLFDLRLVVLRLVDRNADLAAR